MSALCTNNNSEFAACFLTSKMEGIRRECRISIHDTRSKERCKMQDSVRDLVPSMVITDEAEMQNYAKKFVKSANSKNMILIKNSLLLGANFVHAFLQVDAALPKLLRLFYESRTTPKLQLLAGHILVNLSLGSEEDCIKIATQAGPYLVMQIEGANEVNPMLAADTASVIGNLSSHKAVAVLLKKQGAFCRISRFITSQHEISSSAAIYGLTQVLYHCQDLFLPETLLTYVKKCLECKKLSTGLLVLISLMSHHLIVIGALISARFHLKAFILLCEKIDVVLKKTTEKDMDEIPQILLLVRILGNMSTDPLGQVATGLLADYRFSQVIQTIFSIGQKFPEIRKEALWMCANILKHESQPVQGLCEKLNLFNVLSDTLMNQGSVD